MISPTTNKPGPDQPTSACPVCNSAQVTVFMQLAQMPVNSHVLCRTPDEAKSAMRGDMEMAFCGSCGHVFNQAFDPALMSYTQSYENSLHFSPRFQSFAHSLASRLIERHHIYGKDIVEIGSGKGEFLHMICEMGGNRGYGFDPSYVPDANTSSEHITFVQDFYSEQYADYAADLICCRHVLEHIAQPQPFIANVRRAVGDRLETVVFFEVPNVLYTLEDMGIWDLIYEHCAYFSPASLAYLFASCGFEVLDVREEYGDQFLTIEARVLHDGAPAPQKPDVTAISKAAAVFGDNYRNRVSDWNQRLAQLSAEQKRVVAWGAGSKGITFLNAFAGTNTIDYIVDLNPRKHGMYTVGSGQRIVPPDFLADYQPDAVIIMNPLYQEEIRQSVTAMGLSPDLLCV